MIATPRPEYMTPDRLASGIFTLAFLGGLLWTAMVAPRREKSALAIPK